MKRIIIIQFTAQLGSRYIRLMVIALAMCLGLSIASAKSVLIVLSSESKQYQLCGLKASEVIGRDNQTDVSMILLTQLKQSDLDALTSDDVCLAIGAKAAATLSENLDQSVPLVYSMVPNPSGLGLNARQNTTGISADVPPSVQFDLMKQAFSSTRSVSLLYRSSSQRSVDLLANAHDQLPEGWVLKAVDMDQFETDAKAVQSLVAQRADFALMISDPKVYSAATVKALLIASIRNKFRVFAFSPQVVKAGALIGIGLDPSEQGNQVGLLITRVQRDGVEVVQRQQRTDPMPQIAINKIVAKRIGVSILSKLLKEADYLYE